MVAYFPSTFRVVYMYQEFLIPSSCFFSCIPDVRLLMEDFRVNTTLYLARCLWATLPFRESSSLSDKKRNTCQTEKLTEDPEVR